MVWCSLLYVCRRLSGQSRVARPPARQICVVFPRESVAVSQEARFFFGFVFSVLFVQAKDWGRAGWRGPRRAVSVSFFKECSRFFCDFVFSVLSAKSVLSFSDCLIRFSVASRGLLPCGAGFDAF